LRFAQHEYPSFHRSITEWRFKLVMRLDEKSRIQEPQ